MIYNKIINYFNSTSAYSAFQRGFSVAMCIYGLAIAVTLDQWGEGLGLFGLGVVILVLEYILLKLAPNIYN